MTVLLGDILGFSSDQKEDEGHSWSVADMAAWLRSYFVAKEELETRLNTLTATLQRKSAEGMDLHIYLNDWPLRHWKKKIFSASET